MFWPGLNAVRVLLLCLFWPRIQTSSVRGKLEVDSSKKYIPDAGEYHGSPDSEINHETFGRGGTVTTRSYRPVLNLSYTWQNHQYQADNQDFWNHRSGYTQQEAKNFIAQITRQPLTIRVNPVRPQELFLGARHFPWVLGPIFLIVGGLVLTGATGALVDDFFELIGVNLPLIADRSLAILVVPVGSLGFLVLEALQLIGVKLKPQASEAPAKSSAAKN